MGIRNGSGLKIRVNATNRDDDDHYNVLIHAEKLVNSVTEMGKYTMKAKVIIM